MLETLRQTTSRTGTRRTEVSSLFLTRVASSAPDDPVREEFALALFGSFPIEWDHVVFEIDTLAHSISDLFVSQVRHLGEVERIFWRMEDDRIRIWVVIDQPDLAIEGQIYKAHLDLMDALPDKVFDLSAIFRQGKPEDQISPRGAIEIYHRR